MKGRLKLMRKVTTPVMKRGEPAFSYKYRWRVRMIPAGAICEQTTSKEQTCQTNADGRNLMGGDEFI